MRVLTAFWWPWRCLRRAQRWRRGAWAAGTGGDRQRRADRRVAAPFIVGDSAILTIKVTNTRHGETSRDVRANMIPNWDPFEGDPPNLTGSGCTRTIAPAVAELLRSRWLLAPGASAQIQITSTLPALGPSASTSARTRTRGQSAEALDPHDGRATVEPKADIKLDLSASTELGPSGAGVTVRALVTQHDARQATARTARW